MFICTYIFNAMPSSSSATLKQLVNLESELLNEMFSGAFHPTIVKSRNKNQFMKLSKCFSFFFFLSSFKLSFSTSDFPNFLMLKKQFWNAIDLCLYQNNEPRKCSPHDVVIHIFTDVFSLNKKRWF